MPPNTGANAGWRGQFRFAVSVTSPAWLSSLSLDIMRIAFFSLFIAVAFVAASHATKSPDTEQTCVFVLTQIDGATQQWAFDHKKNSHTKPTWKDVGAYLSKSLKRGTNGIPVCPQGGRYTLGATVGDQPTCSIGGPNHSLPKE